MMSTETVAREISRADEGRSLPANGAAILLGAVMMTWPAFYNGFPLLYPDSMTYLGDGSLVARKIFLHQSSNYYGMRSLFYSLGILPLHWNVTAWPVVAFQAILTAYVLWLVVRSILPRRTVAAYLGSDWSAESADEFELVRQHRDAGYHWPSAVSGFFSACVCA